MTGRLIAAFLFAALAGPAFAHAPDIIVPDNEMCPPGTHEVVPSYVFQDGRFVRNGKVCRDITGRN